MAKKKLKHEHKFSVYEFYTGNERCIAVAILGCQCGERIWEELSIEEMEETP